MVKMQAFGKINKYKYQQIINSDNANMHNWEH